MSTNYYLKRTPTEEERKKAKDLIDQQDYDAAIACLSDMSEELHVGKSSYGWKFSFQIAEDGLDMGDKDLTRKNVYEVISDYLKRGYELIDEYEDKVSLSELIDLVESKVKEEEHYESGHKNDKEIVNDGVRWISCWYM